MLSFSDDMTVVHFTNFRFIQVHCGKLPNEQSLVMNRADNGFKIILLIILQFTLKHTHMDIPKLKFCCNGKKIETLLVLGDLNRANLCL